MRQVKISPTVTYRDPGTEAYLRWISRLPLLTPSEEVELAEQIRKGGKAGERAKQRLVTGNLRFVVSVANQYHHQSNGMQLADIIEHGNIGLIRAAEKYDETRGFRFISYAVWWIRQSILQGIAEHGRMVRLPLNQVGALNRLNRVKYEFEQEHQRQPTVEELSELTEIPVSKIQDVMNAAKGAGSVDATIGDGDTSVAETLQADVPDTDATLHQESLSADLKRAMAPLSEREREIVKLFFGIDCREMSLEEIGQRFELTRERVRQIKEKAVRRMRHNAAQLQSYL